MAKIKVLADLSSHLETGKTPSKFIQVVDNPVPLGCKNGPKVPLLAISLWLRSLTFFATWPSSTSQQGHVESLYTQSPLTSVTSQGKLCF